jgi:catecholate siderophore receptor
MNFSSVLDSESLGNYSLVFSNPFQVLGSAGEWTDSFKIKPVDIYAVSLQPKMNCEAVRKVMEDLKETSQTWVSIRRFLQGALLTGCLLAVPAGAWALDYGTSSSDSAAVSSTDVSAVSTPSDNTSTTMPELTVIGTSNKPKALSTTKYSGPLNETPQTATVVDQDQMQEQGITTMRDALRDVSGISLAAGEFSQQGDTLTVRGFSINHDFFLDGMRDYGSYYRDPFFLSEIEVLEGPSGLLFGDGTTGGAVNQVSKQPSLSSSVQGSLGFGTDDNTRRATADINEPISGLGSDVALRLNVMAEQANVSQRNDAKNTLDGLAPVLEFGIGTPTRLTLSYLHEDENSIPDYGIPWFLSGPAPVAQQNYYGFINNYLQTSVDLESVKFEHDFDPGLAIQEQVRYGNYYRNVQITEPQVSPAEATSIMNGSLDINNAPVSMNQLAVYSTETSFDNQTDLTGNFKTAGIKHTFDVGAEEVIETSDPTRLGYTGLPNQNLMSPNENLYFSGTSSITSVSAASVTTLAGFAVDTIDLDEKWEVIGGLRFDYIDSVFYGSNPSTGGVTNVSQTVTPLNWRAGLIFKPQENSSIYFVSGTSTDPSAENLSLSSTTANLAPVQMTSFEFGTKWGILDNQLNLTASAFWDEEDNAQVEDPNNPTGLVDAGTERARGFSLGAQGYITKQWEVMAGYTFLDSEYLDYSTASVTGTTPNAVTVVSNFTGDALRNAPQDTVDLFTSYDLTEKFTIGAGLNAVTDRNGAKYAFVPPTTPGSYTITGPLEDVPGYITFNGMVKYNLDKNISLQANGSNLGNAYYIDEVHPGHIVPGAGRTVLISTNFKF